MRKLILLLLFFGISGIGWSQCGPNGRVIKNPFGPGLACTGYFGGTPGTGTVTSVGLVGTAGQLTVTGSTPITTSGSWTISVPNLFTFPGKVTFHSGGTANPAFNIPTSAAPTSPASGDFWNLSGILQYYDGSATKSLITGAAGSSGQVQFNNSGAFAGDSGLAYNSGTKSLGVIGPIVTGQTGTATGQISFNGLTSGTAILKPADIAGTPTITLPGTTGTLGLVPGSSGQVVWNNSGALGASSGLAYNDTTKALGVIGSITTGQTSTGTGSILFNGLTSGTLTLKPLDAAGTVTLTLPARTATVATSSGTLTSGNCAQFDASGNLVDSGAVCGTSGTPGYYSVTTYGATGNGTTDDSASIRTAMAAVCTAGGGTLVFPAGTYIIDPAGGAFVICSNMKITGAGTIKVKNNDGDYGLIFAPSPTSAAVNNFIVDGISIDQNIANNTSSTIIVGTAGTLQQVFQIFNGSNIWFKNMNVQASGVYVYNTNGTVAGVHIEHNNVTFNKRAGQAVFDNSAIYINGDQFNVADNVFTAANAATGAGTAIELHEGTGTVTGNTVNQYSAGMNLVNLKNSSVTSNAIQNVGYGISIWSLTGSTTDGLTLAGNTISVDQVTRNIATSWGIATYYSASQNGAFLNLVIQDNVIKHELETASRTITNSTNYGIGLQALGNITNATVDNNLIINAPVRGITVGVANATYTTSHVNVLNNRIVDAGSNFSTGTSAYAAAIAEQGNLTSVDILRNKFDFTSNPFIGNYSVWSVESGYTFSGVTTAENKLTAVNGSPANGLTASVSQIYLASTDVPTLPFSKVTTVYTDIVGLWASGSCTGFLKNDGTCASAGGTGTVTSVGLAGTTNEITVTGTSPITSSGSWTLSIPATLDLSGKTSVTVPTSAGAAPTASGTLAYDSTTNAWKYGVGGTTKIGIFSDVATLSNLASVGTITTGTWNGTVISAAKGGTGIANTATLTLGSSNQNWATLGTGVVKNTTTTGALSNAAAGDIYGLWSGSCSASTYLRGDGACATPSGTGGTVTVVASGSLTSTALVTGGGTTTLQTPSATATMDASGNISTPGTITTGAGGATSGSVALSGSTSGTVTQSVAAAAGTWSFTWPTSGGTNKYALTTNGSGVGSWSQVDLTAAVTGILPTANGGTANGFFTVAGPATSAKTFTFPNASANVLTDNALVTAAQGGTNNGFFQVSGPATTAKTFTFPNASANVLTDNALVTVAQGGTGAGTFTANAPLIGAGTGAITVGTKSGSTTTFATSTGTLTNGHCVSIDASGNFVDAGGACTTGGGGGTVNSGTANQLAYYATSTNAVSGNANLTISGSDATLGVAGSAVGTLSFGNATSGTVVRIQRMHLCH